MARKRTFGRNWNRHPVRHGSSNQRVVADNQLAEAAGRAAYLAAYHAAQPYIFENTGKAAKTQGGVRSEFARLAKADKRIDRTFPTFLACAYNLKEIADYAIGGNIGITLGEADQAIAMRFVDDISQVLAA